jgi:hypothetical protein
MELAVSANGGAPSRLTVTAVFTEWTRSYRVDGTWGDGAQFASDRRIERQNQAHAMPPAEQETWTKTGTSTLWTDQGAI